MIINLWLFLTISAVSGILFSYFVAKTAHEAKMKKLDIEQTEAQNKGASAEFEQMVAKKLADQQHRIEVLEAIVTDKNYDLKDKINDL